MPAVRYIFHLLINNIDYPLNRDRKDQPVGLWEKGPLKKTSPLQNFLPEHVSFQSFARHFSSFFFFFIQAIRRACGWPYI